MKGLRLLALGLAVLATAMAPLRAQEESPTYADEYALFERINAEQDAAKKQALILEFIQKYKKSVLDPNIAYLYAQTYAPLRQRGAWSDLAAQAEKYLRYRPNDVEAIKAATEAYQKLGNPQKLVDFGTKLYAQAPNANTAYFVAKAYQSSKDQANFRRWAERVVQHDADNLEMLVELVGLSWNAQDIAKASSYAQRVLKVLPTVPKPAGQTDQQWNQQTSQIRAYSHRAIGERAYTTNDIKTALDNFATSVKFDRKNDFAHYRLGFCYWKTGKTSDALVSFAKAFVLNGPSSPDARNQLNQLYQSTHGNTAGIATIIQRAREELK